MAFGILLSLIPLVIAIFVILAIFQIRDYTRETASKLDAIYQLLSEKTKQEKEDRSI